VCACVCAAAAYLLVLAACYLQGRVWATSRHPGGLAPSPGWQLSHPEGASSWREGGGICANRKRLSSLLFRAPQQAGSNPCLDHGSTWLENSWELMGPRSNHARARAPLRFCLPARAGGPTSPRLPTAHRSHTQSEETHAEGLKHAY
jgi:hypothetical protein